MADITIDATSFGRFAARLRARANAAGEIVKGSVGLGKLANEVRTNAVRMILDGEPSGRMYGNHQASAPGEPPASDTGQLARGVQVRKVEDGYHVASTAPYSSWLEYGTKNMAARPFMYPALAQALPNLQGIIRAAWMQTRLKVGDLSNG